MTLISTCCSTLTCFTLFDIDFQVSHASNGQGLLLLAFYLLGMVMVRYFIRFSGSQQDFVIWGCQNFGHWLIEPMIN